MAVRRSLNVLNQMRLDVPHIKSIESAVRNDFDELIGGYITKDNSYIIRGFELEMTGAIGNAATALQLIVADSVIFHSTSTVSGTFLKIPTGTPNEVLNSTTNNKVTGSFTPSSINYVGLEFSRNPDSSTVGQLFFWDPSSQTEFSKVVPNAELLDYTIYVSTAIWPSNVIPIAVVETDASNNVTSIEDRRPMLFRLGTAGASTPNPFYVYPWTNHSEGRLENYWKASSPADPSPFRGGDKQIFSLKEWMDAIMSALKEIKGTTYWYSDNSFGGSLIKLREDTALTQLTGSGKFYHSATTAGQINWDSDIYLHVIGSRLKYKIEANAATTDVILADNQVAYIKLVRGVDIGPNLVFTNGSAIVTSVGGASWTSGLEAGDFIKIATDDDSKYYEIASVDSASQVTLTTSFTGASTGSAGTNAQYAYGVYRTDPAPSTDRHVKIASRENVPFDADIFWLFLREDNGGTTAKIYIKGSSGGELEQGENRQISDNQTLEILQYVGSPSETDTTPDYLNALTTATAEVTQLTFPAGSAFTSGDHFFINSALSLKSYVVYYTVDGVASNPRVPDKLPIEVQILSTDTAAQVGTKTHNTINAISDFNSVDGGAGTITVTNAQVGDTVDASVGAMPAGFSISITTQGAGAYNFAVIDSENLTQAIKRLDEAVLKLDAKHQITPYEEQILIVSGAPSSDKELTGPVLAGTNVKIPTNSLNGVQESFTAGQKEIEIYLNGAKLNEGEDYSEVSSTEVQFTFDLQVGDVLLFRKPELLSVAAAGGSTGQNLGSAGANKAEVYKQNVGSTLQFRRLQAGSRITLTQDPDYITITANTSSQTLNVNTTTSSITLTANHDVVLCDTTSGGFNVNLPDASTVTGKVYNIKKISTDANTLTVLPNGAQTIDGAASLSTTVAYESWTLVSDGANWWII